MTNYIIAITIAIPIFILLISIEAFWGFKKGIKINNSTDIISSLSSGITNTIRDGMGYGIILISYTWLNNNLAIENNLPIWLGVVIAFIVKDFAGYWLHRIHHKINILWNRHIIHHSSEEFNLSCALRQPISDNIKFSALFLIPAALLGIPPYIFAIIGPIHLFMQFWYHTQLIDKLGWLEKIIVTPSHHRVHHAINPEYNRQDIGANVTVYTELHEITKPVINGSSFLSSNDIRLHFGLGDASIVQNVKVRWADGIEEDFGTFKVNQQVKLEKGKSTFN